jgi:hypothetical protein
MTDTKKAVGPQALAQLEEQELEALAQQLAGRLEAPLETERRRRGARASDLAVTLEICASAVDRRGGDPRRGHPGRARLAACRAVARRIVGTPALMVLARRRGLSKGGEGLRAWPSPGRGREAA